MKTKTPLRYPGGKSRACKYIDDIFPKEVTSIASPFLGGGSIEVQLGCSGRKVTAYDLDQTVVSFWQSCLEDSVRLAAMVLDRYFPLKKDEYLRLKKEIKDGKYRGMEEAAVFYALNGAARAGNIATGGFNNPNDVPAYRRFTLSGIQRLAKFSCPGLVSVSRMSFQDSIPKHPDDFLYLDPPYAIKTPIYLGHSNFPHEELALMLRERGNWVCFYNNAGDIPRLYDGFRFITMDWSYGMAPDKFGKKKESNEILIVSDDYRISKGLSEKFRVDTFRGKRVVAA